MDEVSAGVNLVIVAVVFFVITIINLVYHRYVDNLSPDERKKSKLMKLLDKNKNV